MVIGCTSPLAVERDERRIQKMQTAVSRNESKTTGSPGVVYRTICQNPGCGFKFDLKITPQNASLLSGTMAWAHQRKALRGQATVPPHRGRADAWRRGRNGSGLPLLTWTRGSSNLDGLSLDPLPYRYGARRPGTRTARAFLRGLVGQDGDQPPATGTAATPCRLRILGRSIMRLIHASMLPRLLPSTSIPISFSTSIRGANPMSATENSPARKLLPCSSWLR